MQRAIAGWLKEQLVMTPVSETPLEALHTTATEIFTGALKAATSHPLSTAACASRAILSTGSCPTAAGPARHRSLRLQAHLRHCASARPPAPMLETLLDRMKRRKGLRGICCSNQLPAKRNWRFRYFEGGHPLAQRGFLRRRARRAGAAAQGQERHAHLLPHLRRRLGHVRSASRPAHHARGNRRLSSVAASASGAPINEINTLRKHFSAVKGGRLAIGRARGRENQSAAPRRAAALARRALFRPHFARPLHRGRSARAPRQSTICQPNFPRPSASSLSAKICPSRPATRVGVRRSCPSLPWADAAAASPSPPRPA